MPTDPKPLFRPDALRPKLAAFTLPPAAAGARPKLGNWKSLLHSKAAEKMKETELSRVYRKAKFHAKAY
jgi:hypothetical protein